MSYKTVEVDLENGHVTAQGREALPAKARALLTILQANVEPPAGGQQPAAGLVRFLSSPDFALTPEQYRASMEADFFDQ
jgi:hypothetical protein